MFPLYRPATRQARGPHAKYTSRRLKFVHTPELAAAHPFVWNSLTDSGYCGSVDDAGTDVLVGPVGIIVAQVGNAFPPP
jgi:hypothetical protein